MKMMWFTLWSEPTGVAKGVGVGVGPAELRPSPAHPVRTNSNRKARTHASDILLQRVIGPTWAKWRFAVAAPTDGFEQQLTFIPSDVFSLLRVG
jgi:hypothetical protein